eukprot:scaffold3197_cov52-Attheya_sp.AAC.1
MSEKPVRRQSTSGSVAHGAAEMTRRMVCGGLADCYEPFGEDKNVVSNGRTWFSGKAKSVGSVSIHFEKRRCSGTVGGQWCEFTASISGQGGGLSGMSATLLTYPLDLARGRISGKLAGANHQRHYSGIINTVVLTVKEEGFRALYKGVTPTILGAMPYEGIKFGTVGLLESIFPATTTYNEHGEKIKPSVWRKVCYGGAGGVMAGIITYPNDTVRRMLQLQGSRGTTDVYTGYW